MRHSYGLVSRAGVRAAEDAGCVALLRLAGAVSCDWWRLVT